MATKATGSVTKTPLNFQRPFPIPDDLFTPYAGAKGLHDPLRATLRYARLEVDSEDQLEGLRERMGAAATWVLLKYREESRPTDNAILEELEALRVALHKARQISGRFAVQPLINVAALQLGRWDEDYPPHQSISDLTEVAERAISNLKRRKKNRASNNKGFVVRNEAIARFLDVYINHFALHSADNYAKHSPTVNANHPSFAFTAQAIRELRDALAYRDDFTDLRDEVRSGSPLAMQLSIDSEEQVLSQRRKFVSGLRKLGSP